MKMLQVTITKMRPNFIKLSFFFMFFVDLDGFSILWEFPASNISSSFLGFATFTAFGRRICGALSMALIGQRRTHGISMDQHPDQAITWRICPYWRNILRWPAMTCICVLNDSKCTLFAAYHWLPMILRSLTTTSPPSKAWYITNWFQATASRVIRCN